MWVISNLTQQSRKYRAGFIAAKKKKINKKLKSQNPKAAKNCRNYKDQKKTKAWLRDIVEDIGDGGVRMGMGRGRRGIDERDFTTKPKTKRTEGRKDTERNEQKTKNKNKGKAKSKQETRKCS